MAMSCDFWTLQRQPRRFLELFKLYMQVQGKVQEEQNNKQMASMKQSKGRGRGR